MAVNSERQVAEDSSTCGAYYTLVKLVKFLNNIVLRSQVVHTPRGSAVPPLYPTVCIYRRRDARTNRQIYIYIYVIFYW